MITWENYEEYIMMYADGELSPAAIDALMAFVNEHPELKKELAAYERTRMTPDTSMVFTDKDTLLKPLPAKRIIAFPVWRKYSIAAGIAAIIVISLYKYTSDNNPIAIAKTDTVKKGISVQPFVPVIAATQETKIQASHQDTVIKSQPVTTVVALVAVPKIGMHKSLKSKNEPPVYIADASHDRVIRNTGISSLPLANAQPILADMELAVATSKEAPAYATQSVEEAPKRTFWDKVPLNEIKKQQLENLAGAIAGAYEQVNEAKQTIEDKKLIVRVEKRKLMISF